METGLHRAHREQRPSDLPFPLVPGQAADDLHGVLRFFIALCDSLREYQHRAGPHLAVCPLNLGSEADGTVLLVRDAEAPVAYISPEQTGRMNRQVDHRSDYYSLGVLFYEMLTGHLPFGS